MQIVRGELAQKTTESNIKRLKDEINDLEQLIAQGEDIPEQTQEAGKEGGIWSILDLFHGSKKEGG